MIDFRSDFLTRPTTDMVHAMVRAAAAAPGHGARDDNFVKELEASAAEVLGKEDALFIPTCTMANQIAVRVYCAPGDGFITEDRSHIYLSENFSFASLSGATAQIVTRDGFAPDPAAVEALLRMQSDVARRCRLIWLENTHVHGGGRIVTLARSRQLAELAKSHGRSLHLDGARIFNAAAALDCDVRAFTQFCDSVAISLNKGLGAPMGAILAGSKTFVAEAAKARQLLGGGWRPATILAAAGSIALGRGAAGLTGDNKRAKLLAARLAMIDGLDIDDEQVETNIVFVCIQDILDVEAIIHELSSRGIEVGRTIDGSLRLVLYPDIDDEGVRRTVDAFSEIVLGQQKKTRPRLKAATSVAGT